MCRTLRRHGHISERLPGNIASALHGPATQARAGAYMALDNPVAQSPDQGTATFLSSTESGQAASPWDTLLPSTLTSGNPFVAWSDPGQASNPLQPSSQNASFPVNLDTDDQDEDWEDATSSSATSSDEGDELIPDSFNPGTSAMTDAEASEALFYQHRMAKKAWRRFNGKPVRRFRRFFKRSFRRKGKCKGKGKRGKFTRGGFFYTQDDVQCFLKGKGKGHRAHT